ncbi:hypothetical protein RM553_11140 [Zunongwangia sp. F363]|uniref:DUF748 domain-containing protein n=1 Tax=Autumnicola tepida TaxID=3075595 RepID=A0ABU3CAM2_9FLAO|nr:hypothetical protein [Zunongwangia sp. F363]MDT0643386.1 hypothetical protein [Zunongwangia sp. F363]
MNKTQKIISIIAGVIVFLVILLLVVNNIAENKLKKGLEDALSQTESSYENLEVSLLNKSASIENVQIRMEGKTISVAQAKLQGIDIIKYLFSNKIIVGDFTISEPHVLLMAKKDSSGSKKKSPGFKQDILIKNLIVNNGDVKISQGDSVAKLFTTFSKIKLQEVSVNKNTLKGPVPFKYDGYSITSDSLFFQMNDLHTLTVGSINAEDGKISVKNIKMIPKYSKVEHQRHIPYEKDRYDLTIGEIMMKDFSWKIKNDSLQFQNPYMELNDAELIIYRDKRPPDDPRTKHLYSQMLRELPVKVGIDSLEINRAYINYTQKLKADRPAGTVDFSNLYASIYNLTNIGMDKSGFPKTQIDVRTDLYQKAALKVHWEFDVSDVSDHFTMSGNLGHLDSDEINEFLTPAMNVKVSGAIDDLIFDFSGDDDQAGGDLELAYNDFKVEVLKNNGQEKNNFLSAIANVFVKNTTDAEKDLKDITVTREKTKSFWNYLWIFVRKGSLKTII